MNFNPKNFGSFDIKEQSILNKAIELAIDSDIEFIVTGDTATGWTIHCDNNEERANGGTDFDELMFALEYYI